MYLYARPAEGVRVSPSLAVVCLKPGFHYPSWRPELTGDRFPLPVNTGRQHGPSTRVVETGLNNVSLPWRFVWAARTNIEWRLTVWHVVIQASGSHTLCRTPRSHWSLGARPWSLWPGPARLCLSVIWLQPLKASNDEQISPSRPAFKLYLRNSPAKYTGEAFTRWLYTLDVPWWTIGCN